MRRRVISGSPNGGPGQSRTADQQFRKLLLYPSELQGLYLKAGLVQFTAPCDQRLVLQQAGNRREQYIRRVAFGKKAVRKLESSRLVSARRNNENRHVRLQLFHLTRDFRSGLGA